MLFDGNYLLLILFTVVASMGAQFYLSSTYGRWSRTRNARDLTGAEVARDILDANGLQRVSVERVAGQLTDHYDPIKKVVRLSEVNFDNPSLAALAVAAHEVGHAVQDQQSYAPLRLRARLLPALAVGTNLGPWMIIIGLFTGLTGLAWVGLLAFAAALLFHLITLPVEFDASRRALVTLQGNGYLSRQETGGARSVLTAAALTYVVGFLVALAQVVYWFGLVSGGRRNN